MQIVFLTIISMERPQILPMLKILISFIAITCQKRISRVNRIIIVWYYFSQYRILPTHLSVMDDRFRNVVLQLCLVERELHNSTFNTLYVWSSNLMSFTSCMCTDSFINVHKSVFLIAIFNWEMFTWKVSQANLFVSTGTNGTRFSHTEIQISDCLHQWGLVASIGHHVHSTSATERSFFWRLAILYYAGVDISFYLIVK